MSAFRKIAGRRFNRRRLAIFNAGALLALFLAVVLPSGLVPAGGSAALAELLARSPGERIGGTALKAKPRRAALAPLAEAPPQNAFASVLGASAGPEGDVPDVADFAPGDFPSDFLAPDAPVGTISPPEQALVPGLPGSPFAPLPALFPPLPEPGGTGPAVGGVPEPATWLMLILGFGLIGQAARRRPRPSLA